MTEHLYPAVFALFVWWFSTGVIIYLDGLPRQTFKWSMIGASIILALCLYGLHATANDTSIQGAYLAFTFGLLAWGWQEISFYMGFVTGPRKDPCPDDCKGLKHFWHGVEVGLWHELAIIVAFALVVWLTWPGANHVGLWTFAVLWWMHQSAKLNVFFGVRNLNLEFLPEHLEYLKRYLTQRSMNLLFPFSVTISTVICVVIFQRAFSPEASQFDAVGYTFLGVLMSLAILEHWFLVVPLPSGKLWHWGLKSRGTKKRFDLEVATGFLGSGKTTFLNRRLMVLDPNEKTVALVNDFADLGVDASLLQGNDADIVELPNGCICCSLKKDLATQLKEIVVKFEPDRILIEPSGVADTAALMSVLNQSEIATLTKSTRLYAIVDAGAFLQTFARMPDYFKIQAALNPVFIINKIDLVDEATVALVSDTLKGLNPACAIEYATHGQVDEAREKRPAESAVLQADGHVDRAIVAPAAVEHISSHDHQGGAIHATGEDHRRHDATGLTLESFSARISDPIDAKPLAALLDRIVDGTFGQIDRAKGITRSGNGWLRFDAAGGRARITAFAAQENEEPRFVVIGQTINRKELEEAFGMCNVKLTT